MVILSRLKTSASESIEEIESILINSGIENVPEFMSRMRDRFTKSDIKAFYKAIKTLWLTDIKELFPNMVVEMKDGRKFMYSSGSGTFYQMD